MDIWTVKDKWPQNKRAHIFFNFFVCIFCEMIGKLYLTTMFYYEKHIYKMMPMKNVFNISCANLKIKAVIVCFKNMQKQNLK